MNYSLKENRIRGAADYPFEIYHFKPETEGYMVLPHWHDEMELLYVLSGSMLVNINGNEYTVKNGFLCVINKNELHSVLNTAADTEYYAVVFSMGLISSAGTDSVQKHFINPIINRELLFFNLIESTESLSDLVCKLISVYSGKRRRYRIVLKSLLYQLIDELLDFSHYSELVPKQKNESVMKEIVGYVSKNYSGRIRIDELAALTGMSRNYFCRFFKENFGESFTEYLNRIRVNAAAELLLNSDLNVTEAAFECGYNNPSYFIKRFRSVMGCSPKEFCKSFRSFGTNQPSNG